MKTKQFGTDIDCFHFVSLLRSRGIPHISLIKSNYGVDGRTDFIVYYPFPKDNFIDVFNWLSNDVKPFNEQSLKWTITKKPAHIMVNIHLEATDKEGNSVHELRYAPSLRKIWSFS